MVTARSGSLPATRWLLRPTHVAGVARRPARWSLIVLALLLLAAATLTSPAETPPEFLHDSIVAALRHGGSFYDTLPDLLRTEPDARAARLFPSTLAVVEAALPGWTTTALVAAAATALLWVGGMRLGMLVAQSAGAAMVVALLALGTVAAALLWLRAPHAGAGAILSALAVVARRPGHGTAAAALACAAALIDPAALVAIAALGAVALWDGERREASAWLVAFAVAVLAFALHLHAIDDVAGPAETIGVDGALARLGDAAFPGLPAAAAAPLLLLSAVGWATIGDPVGPRVLAVAVAGVALDGVFGLRSATLAAALVAPGTALAPGAIADLVRSAFGRRRITVTRVAR